MNVTITSEGLRLLAAATTQQPLNLTHFGLGDGGGAPIVPSEDMTTLVNEKFRDTLNIRYEGEDHSILEAVLRATSDVKEGFTAREFGVFDSNFTLVMVASVPEMYVPAKDETDTVVESLFKVKFQHANAENAVIEITEQPWATCEAVVANTDKILTNADTIASVKDEIIEMIEALQFDTSNNLKALVNSSIGVDTFFNINNKYKDQDIINIGIKTWGLAGSIVNIADYPISFENCGAEDLGDGTFKIPEMFDGTIRHIPKGNSRELGSLEEDTLQSLGLSATVTVNKKESFNVAGNGTPNQRLVIPKVSSATKRNLEEEDTKGGYTIGVSEGLDLGQQYYDLPTYNHSHSVPEHSHGATATVTASARQSTETKMKNTAGQFYLLLDVKLEEA